MGQYYMPVNIDNYEHLYTWDYGNGAKLMEHSWLKNNMVLLVMDLISPGGRWEKCRLVWAGDYMDQNLYIPEEYLKDSPKPISLYEYASRKYSSSKLEKLTSIDGPEYIYIINHDKGLYVDLSNLKSSHGWIVHPLPLLTCSGNGRGGGDYRGTYMKYVGSWAGNRVSSSYEFPDGFKKLKVNFKED